MRALVSVCLRPVVCVGDRAEMRLAVAGARARRRAGRSRGSAGARPRCARVPCDARSEVAPRNSLHSLRSLRSNSRGESDHEARCARRPQPCASRRRHSPRLRPTRRLAGTVVLGGGRGVASRGHRARGWPRAAGALTGDSRARCPAFDLPLQQRTGAASPSRGRVCAGAPVRRRERGPRLQACLRRLGRPERPLRLATGTQGFGRRAYSRASSTDSPHLFERNERSE